jgi:long-subunit fatty acid transport protein
MKYPSGFALVGFALACGAVLPQSLRAGGIELHEIGTPDVGVASAGYAARAQDASTLFKNPAGMSLLPGSQFQAGAQLTYGNVAFSPDGSTATSTARWPSIPFAPPATAR